MFFNESCSVLDDLPGDFVTFGPSCTVNILMMCNGVVNCDDCIDENLDSCLQIECAGGKFYLNFCSYIFDSPLLYTCTCTRGVVIIVSGQKTSMLCIGVLTFTCIAQINFVNQYFYMYMDVV